MLNAANYYKRVKDDFEVINLIPAYLEHHCIIR